MNAPFVHFAIQPGYGTRTVFVKWRVNPEFQNAQIYVYRSEKGLPGTWKILNEDAPVNATLGAFHDADIPSDATSLRSMFYRALAVLNGELHDGPVTSTFDHLNKMDFNAARRMLLNELIVCRRTNLKVLHFIPRPRGARSKTTDLLTGQQIKFPCPNDVVDVTGPGAEYGFYKPVESFLTLTSAISRRAAAQQDGTGSITTTLSSARFLPFPALSSGHVFVHVPSDTRYLVMPDYQMHAFNGLAAINYTGSVELLPKSDWRYKLPVDEFLPSPYL